MDTTAGTIVVGVDGSKASERALHWAVDRAVAEHRPVTLAHALGTVSSMWTDAALVDPHDAREALEDEGRAVLAAAADEVRRRAPGLVVHEVVRIDDAREMLLDLSRDAALVVIGSRGRGRVRRLLLGSVGVAVIRHASCPVVVHRPGNRGVVRHGIVVGADASEESRPVLEFAFREASLRRLPLTVLHCFWDAQAVISEAHLVPRDVVDLEHERLALAESTAGLGEKYPEVGAHTEMARGLPQEALVRRGERMDLIVVGSHHLSRTERMLFGSVSMSVVEHASTPVAVVPLSPPDA